MRSRSGRSAPRRAAPRSASRGASFLGPWSMACPDRVGRWSQKAGRETCAPPRPRTYCVKCRNLMGFLVAFKATGTVAPTAWAASITQGRSGEPRIIDGFGRFRLIIAANKARRLQAEGSLEGYLHE